MTVCETPDFMFPLQASVYHPIVEQGDFGAIKKQWILDRTFACTFSSGGSAFKEEVKPNVNITQNSILVGRTKSDIRISSLFILIVAVSSAIDKDSSSSL